MMAGVAVGLLGAFTTFSTLSGELWDMLDQSDWEALGAYAAASVGLGGLAAWAGLRVGGMLR